jgi:hypothetical protein
MKYIDLLLLICSVFDSTLTLSPNCSYVCVCVCVCVWSDKLRLLDNIQIGPNVLKLNKQAVYCFANDIGNTVTQTNKQTNKKGCFAWLESFQSSPDCPSDKISL